MNVPAYLAEDAELQAIEAGVKALRRYKPDAGSQEESWVILQMRWSVRSYMRTELSHVATYDVSETLIAPQFALPHAWDEFIAALTLLSEEQRSVLLSTALGIPQSDISRRWKRTGFELKAIRESATAQLRERLIIAS